MPSSTTPKRRRRSHSIEMPRRRRSQSATVKNRSRSRSQSKSAVNKNNRSSSAKKSSAVSSASMEAVIRRQRSRTPQQRDTMGALDYISPESIPNMATYHSSSQDFSILSNYVFQPYWNGVVKLFPTNCAPNLITVMGFLLGMSGPLISFYFLAMEIEVEEFPLWVWAWGGVSLFLYMTFDAVDGKQARRIKASSPLGEFLDHGLDAFITQFVHLNIPLAIGMPPWMASLFSFQAAIALFLCIWEQYTTGTFTLWYITGPTEGITAAVIMFFISAIYSPEFWGMAPFGVYNVPVSADFLQNVSKTFNVELSSMNSVPVGSLRSIISIGFTLSWLLTISVNFLHVFTSAKTPMVHSLMISIPMLLPAIGHVYLYALYPDIHDALFPWFELSVGTLSAICCAKMCVCRLTSTFYKPLHVYYFSFVLFHFGFMALHKIHPTYTVQMNVGVMIAYLTIVGFICYFHFMFSVARQVKRYFKINVFTVNRR